jgi:RNA polymerase sigma-70 factor (ECF subfamily)
VPGRGDGEVLAIAQTDGGAGERSADDPEDAVNGGERETDLAPLVRAARGGDQEAFRLLYRSVQPGLLRYLRGLVGEDAEDLASETWLQIARDLRSFRDQGVGFRGWAATIARHRALDHLRRHRRRPSATVCEDILLDLPDCQDTAEQAMQHASTTAAIALIGTLPRDQAEAVLLRAVVGLDAKATATVMGKRPGAVRTAAWRGLRKLAEQLERAGHTSVDQAIAGTDTARPIGAVTRTAGATPKGMR